MDRTHRLNSQIPKREFSTQINAAERQPPAQAIVDPVRRAADSLGFHHWDELLQAALAAEHFVSDAGLLHVGCSRQKLAAAYEAAFSVDDSYWPRDCRQFFHNWVPRFEELYSHREVAGPELSVVRDLARRSTFISLRNGRRWHTDWRSRGADRNFQWCAFELTNMATEIRRHWRSLAVTLPALGIENFGRRGYDADPDYEHVRHCRRAAVREVLAGMDCTSQRLIRLAFGFFPCQAPFSLARIGGLYGKSAQWADNALHQACSIMERRLASIRL